MGKGLGWRLLPVTALAVAMAAFLTWLPPFPQPLAYHAFADQRAFLGVPRFLDVASNLGLLVVGLMGLGLLAPGDAGRANRFLDPRERLPYGFLFLGVTLTCFGSIYYHLAPDNPRLVWDRLPMAMGFTAFLAAMIAERVSPRAGLLLLFPLVGLGVGSIWYWRWSAAHGAEDLLPYIALQGYCLVASILLIALFPARYTRGRRILAGVSIYAAALIFEQLDQVVYSLTGMVSGHTLKHLLAAAAIYQLYSMLRDRRPV